MPEEKRIKTKNEIQNTLHGLRATNTPQLANTELKNPSIFWSQVLTLDSTFSVIY